MQKPVLVVLSLCILSLAAFLPAVHAQTFVTSIPLGTQNLNQGAIGPPVFDPSNGNIYVSAMGTDDMGTVSIISGSSNTVTSILGLSTPQYTGLPGVGVLDPSNGDVYVPDGPVIHVISGTTNEIMQNISGMDFSGVASLAFDPSNGMIYAASSTQSSLSVIDTSNNSVIATLDIPSGAGEGLPGPLFDPANGDVYVPGFNATTVVSATTNSIVATIPFSNGVAALGVDPSTGSVLAGGTGMLAVISSSNQIVANISSGEVGYPVFDSSDSDFYLLGPASNVVVFSASSDSIVGNVSLNFEQSTGDVAGLAFDSANGDIFATFTVGGVVVDDQPITATFGDIISGTTVLGQVQVSNSTSAGEGAGSAVFDSANGDFYVPTTGGTVSVINPQVISAPSSTTAATSSTKSSSSAISDSYLFLVAVSLAPVLAFYMGSVRRHRRR